MPTEQLRSTIQQNAQKFIKDFEDEGNFDLSETSITDVDHFLEDQHQFGDELNTEYNDEVITLASAYILEVARGIYGGNYNWNIDKTEPILTVGQPEFEISFSIYNKVRTRLETEHSENILYYFNLFTEKVKNAKAGG